MTKPLLTALLLAMLCACTHAPTQPAPSAMASFAREATPPPPMPPPPESGPEARARAEASQQAEASARQRASSDDLRARASAQSRAAAGSRRSVPVPVESGPHSASTIAAGTAGATTSQATANAAGAISRAASGTGALSTDTGTNVVDGIMSQLKLGNVAFNAPASINIEETVSIHVALSPSETAEALEARVEGPGQVVSHALQVANKMEARLSGEGFRIVPVTSERQAVSSGVTEWIWDVTPLTAGKHQLTLTIDALINVNGETVPKTLRTFRKPIEVEVTTTQRVSGVISEHGKWLWTTLLLPIFGWMAKKRSDRKRAVAPLST